MNRNCSGIFKLTMTWKRLLRTFRLWDSLRLLGCMMRPCKNAYCQRFAHCAPGFPLRPLFSHGLALEILLILVRNSANSRHDRLHHLFSIRLYILLCILGIIVGLLGFPCYNIGWCLRQICNFFMCRLHQSK